MIRSFSRICTEVSLIVRIYRDSGAWSLFGLFERNALFSHFTAHTMQHNTIAGTVVQILNATRHSSESIELCPNEAPMD